MLRTDRLRAAWAHAFAVDPATEISEDERVLADRLARIVVNRRMATPAVMALESARPLSFIGSQVLVFFQPLLNVAFRQEDTDRLVRLLERRDGIDLVLDRIQQLEDEGDA